MSRRSPSSTRTAAAAEMAEVDRRRAVRCVLRQQRPPAVRAAEVVVLADRVRSNDARVREPACVLVGAGVEEGFQLLVEVARSQDVASGCCGRFAFDVGMNPVGG